MVHCVTVMSSQVSSELSLSMSPDVTQCPPCPPLTSSAPKLPIIADEWSDQGPVTNRVMYEVAEAARPGCSGQSVARLGGQTRRSDSAVRLGGQTRRSDSAVRLGGQTRRSDSAVRLGGQTRRSDSAVRLGGQTRRSDSAVSQWSDSVVSQWSDSAVRLSGQSVVILSGQTQ